MDYSPETKKNYDFFLRIGIDGERRVGKSGLIRKFAEDDFLNGTYEETLHVYVTTTHMHIQLDDYNYNVKVEFLETGWNLRPNKIYYNYIDGAILVYDISDADGLEKIKELSREYVNTDCNNVMIIANKWDKNKQKNRDDLLNEVNNFVGEEFLCDITSIEEKTSTSLEKIIKKCISRLLDFREINDLNELISSSNQFKPMMKHATQLYFYGVIPKKVIDDRRKEILNEEMDEIKSFLLLERVNLDGDVYKDYYKKFYRDGEEFYFYFYYRNNGYRRSYGYKKNIIKRGVKKDENIHAVIAETSFKMSKNLQEILEEAINDVNKYPEKLNLAEVKIYRQKIVTQLEYFKDFDKKALKFEDFDDMINLAYDILFKSANLKSTCPSEMNSLVSEIDKYLPEWINSCTEITNKFNQFYEDLNDFITSNNIGDNLLTFKIQEELLTKIDEIKTDLHKSDKWNKIYLNKEKTRSNFLLIIGLKSVYDLTTELEYARSGFKLFLDPIFIKEILDFWKELIHELRSSEKLVKIFKENELYVKESCFDCIVENLAKIGFCLFKFFRNIVVKKVAKK